MLVDEESDAEHNTKRKKQKRWHGDALRAITVLEKNPGSGEKLNHRKNFPNDYSKRGSLHIFISIYSCENV